MEEYTIKGLLTPAYVRAMPSDRRSREVLRQLYFHLRDQGIPASGMEVEITIRVHDKRRDWIDLWYSNAMEAQEYGNILIRHCQQATFICKRCAYANNEVASAAPRHGDKYDYKTGIAVAYAKVCNQPIPDFI